MIEWNHLYTAFSSESSVQERTINQDKESKFPWKPVIISTIAISLVFGPIGIITACLMVYAGNIYKNRKSIISRSYAEQKNDVHEIVTLSRDDLASLSLYKKIYYIEILKIIANKFNAKKVKLNALQSSQTLSSRLSIANTNYDLGIIEINEIINILSKEIINSETKNETIKESLLKSHKYEKYLLLKSKTEDLKKGYEIGIVDQSEVELAANELESERLESICEINGCEIPKIEHMNYCPSHKCISSSCNNAREFFAPGNLINSNALNFTAKLIGAENIKAHAAGSKLLCEKCIKAFT